MIMVALILVFIDKDNNQVTPIRYEAAGDFFNGLAIVVKNSKLGFINKSGRLVIQHIYDAVTDIGEVIIQSIFNPSEVHNRFRCNFWNEFARVKLNGKFGYIDKLGTQYWED
jgi:hypothetical protein